LKSLAAAASAHLARRAFALGFSGMQIVEFYLSLDIFGGGLE
jgi:hypothetical protein